MMNYRSNSDFEHHGQKKSESSPSSPKIGMIASASDTNDLHPTPTALLVSPSGERFTCTLDSLNNPSNLNNTNPFSGNSQIEPVHKNSDSDIDIDCVPKCPSKKAIFRQKNRRKIQVKDRRKADRKILSPRCVARSKQIKCVSIQTDEDNSYLHLNCFPECIGDGRALRRSGMDFMSSTITETSKDGQISSIDNFFAQYLSESLRTASSFLLMIILIFWITSMILEVDIPAELIRIASNYVRSFKWGYNQKEPQTFVEKFWDYMKNIFKL